jgi:Rha family phage regulatory protein
MKNETKEIVVAMKAMGDGQRVSSRFIAEKFGKSHKNVIQSIENIDCSEEFSRLNFQPSDFEATRGKFFKEYLITRDGFSFLCMGFTGKEAARWKERFIEAFNAMERELLKQNDKLEWKAARLQIKAVRHSFTDTIKDFVEYATAQGSESAHRYYTSLTKMEYAALGLVEYGSKVPDGFRDSLDLMGLGFLTAAEQIARRAIAEGMNRQMHYKDIYQFAKGEVMRYAEAIKLPMIEEK